jgi:hypothetical protein
MDGGVARRAAIGTMCSKSRPSPWYRNLVAIVRLAVIRLGGSDTMPLDQLGAAIIFAPADALVPAARGDGERRERGVRRHPHERHSGILHSFLPD